MAPSHRATLLTLDTEREVARPLLVTEQHTQLCLIGRSNLRSPYERYVLECWRP